MNGNIQEWVAELDTLPQLADSQPHAAYSALTHSLYSKWNYLAKITSAIENLLSPLEDTRVGRLSFINPAFSETQYHGLFMM